MTLAAALRGLIGDSVAVVRAARGGYAWMTVLETLCDVEGDTGSLISGARRFAALPPSQRSTLRRLRVGRQMMLLVAAMLPGPLLLLATLLGATGVVGPAQSLAAGVVPLGLALVAYELGRPERMSVSHGRRWHGKPAAPVDLSRLAGPWYESFESVRQGQGMGRGLAGHARLGAAGTVVVLVIIVLAIVSTIPLIAVATMPSLWYVAVPKFSNMLERNAIADGVRPWAVPVDSSISPRAAGLAFADLPGQGIASAQRAPVRRPLPWNQVLPAALFPTARPVNFNGPNSLKIIPAARRGFSAAELAYLERVAHSWVWTDFATVARAPAVDFFGATLPLPLPPDVTPNGIPIPDFGAAKSLAYANASRAAYFLATGHPDSAETSVRETIGFGLAISANANTLIEALIDNVIAAIGRDNLVQPYEATGNPDGARIHARVDSVRTAWEGRATDIDASITDQSGVDPRSVRRALVRIAGTPGMPRAERWEALHMLGISACGNVRELVFGDDEDLRDVFALARRDLVRYPADSAMLEVIHTSVERFARAQLPAHPGVVADAIADFGGLSAALMRNPRIAGCARLLATSVLSTR